METTQRSNLKFEHSEDTDPVQLQDFTWGSVCLESAVVVLHKTRTKEFLTRPREAARIAFNVQRPMCGESTAPCVTQFSLQSKAALIQWLPQLKPDLFDLFMHFIYEFIHF